MIVRTATVLDIPFLALVHFQSLPDDFLPSLGQDFLERIYYPAAIKSSNAKTFVVEQDGEVCGFVTVAWDSEKFSQEILKFHWLSITRYALLVIMKNPLYLFKCFEVFWSVLFSKPDEVKGEIVFIAINEKNRGHGIGSHLVKMALEYLGTNNVFQCRTKTLQENIGVVKMYEKMGWRVRNSLHLISRDYVIIVSPTYIADNR
jgi:ribosomal protein S18 acetylase RimI-like enzyme